MSSGHGSFAIGSDSAWSIFCITIRNSWGKRKDDIAERVENDTKVKIPRESFPAFTELYLRARERHEKFNAQLKGFYSI